MLYFLGWGPSQKTGMTGGFFELLAFKVDDFSDFPAEIISWGIDEHAEPGKVLPKAFNCWCLFSL